jgi:hypothetical protein
MLGVGNTGELAECRQSCVLSLPAQSGSRDIHGVSAAWRRSTTASSRSVVSLSESSLCLSVANAVTYCQLSGSAIQGSRLTPDSSYFISDNLRRCDPARASTVHLRQERPEAQPPARPRPGEEFDGLVLEGEPTSGAPLHERIEDLQRSARQRWWPKRTPGRAGAARLS